MFQGVISAIFTPFGENYEFDEDSFRKLIDFQIQGGVNALWFLGSAGMGPSLEMDVRKRVLEVGMEQIGHRVDCIVNVGSASTSSTLSLLKHATNLGVDGIAVLTPYYYSHDEFELYEHYRAIAKLTELPIVIYNNPATTHIDLKTDFIRRLHTDFPQINGIKETTESTTRILTDISLLPSESFAVYPSFESQVIASLPFGAKGVISPVTPNIFPELLMDAVKAISNKDWQKAIELQNSLNELVGIIASVPGTGRYRLFAQEILSLRGLDVNLWTPWPMRQLDDDERKTIRKKVEKSGLLAKYGHIKI
jgi:4-hydroxy-tetrahydrodipicolinate synthase